MYWIIMIFPKMTSAEFNKSYTKFFLNKTHNFWQNPFSFDKISLVDYDKIIWTG